MCLQAVEAAVKAGVKSGGGAALPGMIFNQGKKVTYMDAVSGEEKSTYAGRLECTMQVCLSSAHHAEVPCFFHALLSCLVFF